MYSLLLSPGKLDEAEPLYRKAVEIGETVLGPDHPDLATWLNNLVNTYLPDTNQTPLIRVPACRLRTLSHRRALLATAMTFRVGVRSHGSPTLV